jgi:hypothetical protein
MSVTNYYVTNYYAKMASMNGRTARIWRTLRPAIVWGLIWGIFEATAGHLLHLARVPGLAGWIMFPAGFCAMTRAFAAGGKFRSIFLTACFAAAVKCADLFLPGRDIAMIINPARAILLESLAVIAIYYYLGSRTTFSWKIPVFASVGWRAAYAVLGLFAAKAFGASNILETGVFSVLNFLLIEGAGNGLLVSMIILLWPLERHDQLKTRPRDAHDIGRFGPNPPLHTHE